MDKTYSVHGGDESWDPGITNRLLDQARALERSGDLDEAICLLNRTIITDPRRIRLNHALRLLVEKRGAQRVGQLPIHFFTIVLNGMPFIRYHIDVFRRLTFPWVWHVIEGVAEMNRDSAWPLKFGGRIPASCHQDGLSVDGTTTYLDQIASLYPGKVKLYRPPHGQFWPDKTTMIQQPILGDICAEDDCLLWQIDSDELWRPEQFTRMRRAFIEEPARSAAEYRALFLVGESLAIATDYEGQHLIWPRTWRYRPGRFWAAHEPPTMVEYRPPNLYNTVWNSLRFRSRETRDLIGVFQHYAYVTEEQLRFKQNYYGYSDILERWYALQRHRDLPVKLREYMPYPWVPAEAPVVRLETTGERPLARRDGLVWRFAVEQP